MSKGRGAKETSVRVPATSGNLGAGFDGLGMALDLWLTATVRPASRRQLTWEGEGAGRVPDGSSNLVWRGFDAWLKATGRRAGAVAVKVHSEIPVSRGLGSSAAAIVAGMLLARQATGGGREGSERARRVTREQLQTLIATATRLEGHPDNVVPALVGGVTVSVMEQKGEGADRPARHPLHTGMTREPRVVWCSVPVVRPPAVLLFIPDTELATKEARAVLPRTVSMHDAVFNLSRAALLVAALARGRPELLGSALEDRLHQPYRAPLVPGLAGLNAAARRAGALGGYLSGAGPTLAVLAGAPTRAIRERIDRHCGRGGRLLWTRLADRGAIARPPGS